MLKSEGCQTLAAAVIIKALEDLANPNSAAQDIASAKEFFEPGNVDLEFWCGHAKVSSSEILRAIREGLVTRDKLKSIKTQLCYSPVAERFRGEDSHEAGDPDCLVDGRG